MNIEWLDGLLLGDAGLYWCSKKNHTKAYVTLGSSKRDWTEYGMSGLTEFQVSEPAERPRKDGVDWISRTHSHPELAPQRLRWYPDGKKHIPPDVQITATSLRLFYLGDGNLWRKRVARISFATCDFSREEQTRILIPKMEALGFHCTLSKASYPRLYLLSDSVGRFLKFIGTESKVKSYEYKFNPPSWVYEVRSKDLAKELGCSVMDVNNALNNNGLTTRLDGKFRIFDQETADFVRRKIKSLQSH